MVVSLKTRLTLILALVNAVVLGSLALWVAGDDVQRQASAQRRQSERKALAEELFSKRFEPERAGDLAKMIDWPLWHEFSDALILDTRVVSVGSMQEIHPAGVILNPLGLKNRRPDFPLQEVVRGITESTRRVEKIPVAGGLALPLITPDHRIWGGVFVMLPSLPSPPSISERVLLAAGAATILGAALLYLLVHRSLVAPVEGLAAAAQAFGRHRSAPLPARTGSAEMEGLVGAFRDMRTRLDGFQQELRREVEAATRRAGEAERRAARQDRLAALGTLAAGLAHEINSPLAGVLQGLERIRLEVHSPQGQRYAVLMKDALDRIATLVRRLLQLAPVRVEEGRCVVQEVVRDLPLFLASRLSVHRLELDLPEEPLEANGARGDLFPVLLNVVQNALDALDEAGPDRPGRILLQTRAEPGGGVRITVADDGPGAPEAMLPHLFEPFTSGKEVGRGTGLGLALAFATIRQLEGSIEARNRPEGGLEVTIHLPAARPPAKERV